MQTLTGHRGRVRSLSFSSDGRFLASAAGNGLTISLWDLHQRGRRRYLKGHDFRACAVTCVPGSPLLCSIDSAGILCGWDALRGTMVWSPGGIASYDCTLTVDPRGRFVAAGGSRGFPAKCHVALLPLPEHPPLQTRKITGPGGLRCLACAPDGGTLAIGRARRTVVLHDLATGGVRAELDHAGGVHALGFSPDGRTLAVAAGSLVVLWDTATHERQAVLRGHEGSVTGVAFTPGGRLLVSAGLDGYVRLWDAGGGKRAALDWDIGPLRALALAADGLRGACGSASGAIVLWDLDG